MKQIQIWLGHSNFSTTADIYAHLDMSAQMETGNVAGAFYAKPDRKPSERKEGAVCTAKKGVETCTKKTSSVSGSPKKGTARCRKPKTPKTV